MLIDKILDRRDGEEYSSRDLYNYLQEEGEVFAFYWAIARKMDEGTEKEMQDSLCEYVTASGYRQDVCDYVRSVDWL